MKQLVTLRFVTLLAAYFLTTNLCAADYQYGKDQPLPVPGYPGYDLNGMPCQSHKGTGQGYGPFDYTNPNHRGFNLEIVEIAHFTKKVETLVGGESGAEPYGDLNYTIMAFPNHHRALYSMMRYQLKTSRPVDARYPPVECYFQRAIKFKPNDFRVYQLYANYLKKKDQLKMASQIYQRALLIKNAPAEINYSFGLLYLELKDYDNAVAQAKIAYDRGIKKTKLSRQLEKLGRWPVQ